jgi:hypothetical protein
MDSLESEEDVQEWEAFSAGYGFRVDAGVGGKKNLNALNPPHIIVGLLVSMSRRVVSQAPRTILLPNE